MRKAKDYTASSVFSVLNYWSKTITILSALTEELVHQCRVSLLFSAIYVHLQRKVDMNEIVDRITVVKRTF